MVRAEHTRTLAKKTIVAVSEFFSLSLAYCIFIPFLICNLIRILICIHRMVVTGTSCVCKFQIAGRGDGGEKKP